MKKTIITVLAFVILFGFAVSSVIAQEWSWSQPITIEASSSGQPYVDIVFSPLYSAVSGKINGSDTYETLSLDGTLTSLITSSGLGISGQGIDSVFAPPVGIEYVIDEDTVAIVVGINSYDVLDPQPFIPDADGKFKSIAAGPDGKLYVLFDASDGSQYLLEGTSLIPWEVVKVRFSPRSLNLGSNGRWVTCKISYFPDGYTPADVDMERVCIVAINGKSLAETADPICSKDSGGPYNNHNKKKLMVKFDRKNLADFITANPNTEEPNTANITVAGYSTDGSLQFYGDDTIKIKPAKEKKNKKK